MSEATIAMPRSVATYDEFVQECARIRPVDFIPCAELPGSMVRETLPQYVGNVLTGMKIPYKDHKYIHIAGTNGKGSVAIKLTHSLIDKGYCVGTLTSPHIKSLTERIQWGGKAITEEDMVRHANKVFEALNETGRAFGMVGVVACIAFSYFDEMAKKSEGEARLVIEAGIGGEGDHTNVIPPPLLAIITSIGFDHTEMLGDTLEKIAANKAGIIKERTGGVIIGPKIPESCHAIFRERARQMGCSITIAPEGRDFEKDNQLTAQTALKWLFGQDFTPNPEALRILLPARHQVVSVRDFTDHKVIFDGGHNPAGIHAFLQWLKPPRNTKHIALILAMSKTKDLEESLGEIAESDQVKSVYLLKLQDSSLYPSKIVQKACEEKDIECVDLSSRSLEEGLKFVGEMASKKDWRVACTGSFRTLAEVSDALGVDLPSIVNRASESPISATSGKSDKLVQRLFHDEGRSELPKRAKIEED